MNGETDSLELKKLRAINTELMGVLSDSFFITPGNGYEKEECKVCRITAINRAEVVYDTFWDDTRNSLRKSGALRWYAWCDSTVCQADRGEWEFFNR